MTGIYPTSSFDAKSVVFITDGLETASTQLAVPHFDKYSKKRNDLQGLRTLAIVAVLLFHIWPDVLKMDIWEWTCFLFYLAT
uniref:Acyl_transf_3 domain-containing protein n=1 Tax=Ditylenchus dipsaci TaxID=166011 RepID=A0A915CUC4_9BILA